MATIYWNAYSDRQLSELVVCATKMCWGAKFYKWRLSQSDVHCSTTSKISMPPLMSNELDIKWLLAHIIITKVIVSNHVLVLVCFIIMAGT